jgi:hypothetical protein
MFNQGELGGRSLPRGGILAVGSLLGILLLLVIGCSIFDKPAGRQTDAAQSFRWNAGDVKHFLANARYLELMGRPSMALKELEEAHRLFPQDIKVADALAHFYEKLNLSQEAQDIYQEALAVAPDNPTLWNNLGFSYYQSGDLAQAEECYRKALAAQPGFQAGMNNLGLVLCRQGRQEEAREIWQARDGEAAAAQKLSLALGALGMTPATQYAGPRPLQGPGIHHDMPAPRVTQEIHQAEVAPRPALTPSPTAARPSAPGPSPSSTSIEAAAGKLAAVVLPQVKPAVSGEVQPVAAPGQTLRLKAADPPPPAPATPALNEPTPVPAAAKPRKVAAVTTPPPTKAAAPEDSGSQPAPAVSRAAQDIARALVSHQAAIERPKYLTAVELMGTNIAILNGNGIQDLARETRSRLSLEGFSIASIGNFRDFGVDQTVIYYGPGAQHVAVVLNRDFFPRAVVKADSSLASRIDVKVVLGHDFPAAARAATAPPPPGQS